jgi:hypothetical protein
MGRTCAAAIAPQTLKDKAEAGNRSRAAMAAMMAGFG